MSSGAARIAAHYREPCGGEPPDRAPVHQWNAPELRSCGSLFCGAPPSVRQAANTRFPASFSEHGFPHLRLSGGCPMDRLAIVPPHGLSRWRTAPLPCPAICWPPDHRGMPVSEPGKTGKWSAHRTRRNVALRSPSAPVAIARRQSHRARGDESILLGSACPVPSSRVARSALARGRPGHRSSGADALGGGLMSGRTLSAFTATRASYCLAAPRAEFSLVCSLIPPKSRC